MPAARRLSAPFIVLVVGAGALALGLMLSTALRLPAIASFDELVYKLSAAQYASGGPGMVISDDVARGIARLYSLVIAPLFAVLPGDTAVRAARALNTVVWALTAAPVFLLARRVASPWPAVVVALLSIAVPWATISTVLFSESLAYLLFATAVLAMVRALERPAPWLELAVFVLVGALVLTRVQFIAVPVVWVLLVAGLELAPARRRTGAWRPVLAATWRRFPVTVAVVGLAVLVALALFVVGRLDDLISRIGGPYISGRDRLPSDVGLAGLFEVAMLAFGTGVVPLGLAVAWAAHAVGGRLGAGPRRLAVVGLAVVAAVFGVAVAGQDGWPGPDLAEERYFIYAVPLILVGAAAAIELPAIRTRTVVSGGLAVVALLALAPTTAGLSGERAFLVPVAATSTNVAERMNRWIAETLGLGTGTGQRDLVVLAALLVVLLAAVAWRRARLLVLLPAAALQLCFGGYALATMHGQVPGVAGLTAGTPDGSKAWIDRATDGGPDVALLHDRLDPERVGVLSVAFFNDELARTVRVPELQRPFLPYPVSALPFEDASVTGALRLEPAPGARLFAVTVDSAVLQLAGRTVQADGGTALIAPERPPRVTWVARGLAPDGALAGPVAVRAAPARLTLTFDALPEQPGGAVQARVRGRTRRAQVEPGGRAELRVDACGADGPVDGTVEPAGAPPGAVRLRAVDVRAC